MEQNNFAKGMNICYTKKESGDDEEDVVLPGFRFHPTDEELIGFYLRRKVENRVLSIELIKEVDIYKYNPWDLPKASNVGENECYFFCRRARKYRNSIRPNRVTDSGFWKATGIDKPIYSSDQKIIIGLKKSLVFYRGSAGKGTKTEWMLHEFRIPTSHFISKSIKQASQEEAEIWTLCRILKRSKPHKRGITDWKEISLTKTIPANTSSKTWTHDPSPNPNQNYEVGYINFQHTLGNNKQVVNYHVKNSNEMHVSELSSRNQVSSNSPIMIECSMYDELDELWPLVDLTTEPFHALKDITKI